MVKLDDKTMKQEVTADLETLISELLEYKSTNKLTFADEYRNINESIKTKFEQLFQKQISNTLTVSYKPTNNSSNYKPMRRNEDIPKTANNTSKNNISKFEAQTKSEYQIFDTVHDTLQHIEQETVKDDIILTQQSIETSVYEEHVDHLKQRLSRVVKNLTNEGMKKLGERQFNDLSKLIMESINDVIPAAISSSELENALGKHGIETIKESIRYQFEQQLELGI
jgi:hypothetical protein